MPCLVDHALFHAIPAFEAFAALTPGPAAAKSIEDMAVTFLPLAPNSAGIGRKAASDPMRWHGWELSLRALTALSAERIAEQSMRLMRGQRCACFRHVHFSTSAYSPSSAAAAARLGAWRRAVLANAWRSMRSAPAGLKASAGVLLTSLSASRPSASLLHLLYIRRLHSRTIVNEAAFLRLLAQRQFNVSDAGRPPLWRPPTDAGSAVNAVACHVTAVALEEHSLSAQIALVSAARALIAVHGQALAHTVFLGQRAPGELRDGPAPAATPPLSSPPSHGRLSAVIEILPPPPRSRIGREVKPPFWHIFAHLSRALSVVHVQHRAVVARPCSSASLQRAPPEAHLQCNLTVDTPLLVNAVIRTVTLLKARGGTTRGL